MFVYSDYILVLKYSPLILTCLWYLVNYLLLKLTYLVKPFPFRIPRFEGCEIGKGLTKVGLVPNIVNAAAVRKVISKIKAKVTFDDEDVL